MQRQSARCVCGPLAVLVAACTVGALPARGESAGANAEDVVGAWKMKCVSPDGKPRECVVTLSREGSALKGLYSVGGETRAVKAVGFERGELCFCVDGAFAGQTYTLTYKGRPRDGAIRGAVRWKFGLASGSFDFEGERQSQRVALTR